MSSVSCPALEWIERMNGKKFPRKTTHKPTILAQDVQRLPEPYLLMLGKEITTQLLTRHNLYLLLSCVTRCTAHASLYKKMPCVSCKIPKGKESYWRSLKPTSIIL